MSDGLHSGTVCVFQKEYPKLHEVGTNLLGDVDASFSSPEPDQFYQCGLLSWEQEGVKSTYKYCQ